MGSMHTGLEEEKGGFKHLARFYADRVKGGVALIVTGGISPNRAGVTVFGGARLSNIFHVAKHREITQAVKKEGGNIIMQILHACLLYTSPSPRDRSLSRMPSSA